MKRMLITVILAGCLIGSAMTVLPRAEDRVAAYLVERAWLRAQAGELAARPWPWLDSMPVARLSLPRLGQDLVVLRGTAGSVLAHAPGWHDGSVRPGAEGISYITAYSDLHFGWLRNVQPGDTLQLQQPAAPVLTYIVDDIIFTHEPEITLGEMVDGRVLLLSTSYAATGPGPDLYLVAVARALPVPGQKRQGIS